MMNSQVIQIIKLLANYRIRTKFCSLTFMILFFLNERFQEISNARFQEISIARFQEISNARFQEISNARFH